MGTYQSERWISTGAGQSRRQRASGVYRFYIPTLLADRDLSLDADVTGDVAAAQSRIAVLNAQAKALVNTEGIARLLMRAEAVSSSHIEGLTIGTRRLLRAEMALAGSGKMQADANAVTVVGNIRAMECALDAALSDDRITVETLLRIHASLCAGTPIEQFGGAIRTVQNWVGGSSYNPLNASYVPPAPEYVPQLLDDLASFCNRTDLSPIEQAAVAHAQFETIHPFIDGNGRTGRALIHLILRKRGIAEKFVPPISLALATHASDYIDGLVGFRFDDAEDRKAERDGLNDWVSTFSGCCSIACEEAEGFESAVQAIKQDWTTKAGPFRKGSIADEAMDAIVSMPIFTVKTLADHCGKSTASVNSFVDLMERAGCIKTAKCGSRNRVFEAPAVINEFNVLERKLASPAGNTKVAAPDRPVPENLAKANRQRRESSAQNPDEPGAVC
jgi:Fic family protein